MSLCPSCGGEPQATSQDTATGQPWYQCENEHWWQDTDGEE